MTKPRADFALGWLYSQAWMIQPSALEVMTQIASRQMSDLSAVMDKRARRLDPEGSSESRISGDIAVIDINGPIFARAGFFEQISGASDVEALSAEFSSAMKNPNISGIVLHIDSPGGEVSGTSELAALIASARGKKKVYAYVQGSAASGAYWLASATEKIFMADTAIVGSIGVVMGYRDEEEKNAKNGVKSVEIVSSQSPDKRVNPTTDAGRIKVQETVDSLAEVFVQTVAKNRGVSAETVVKEFGQGWVKVGADAVRLKMADGISTLNGVLEMMKNERKGAFNMTIENKEAPKVEAAQAPVTAPVASQEDAIKAAVAAERARISSIESLKATAPGHEALIDRLKMEEGMTADKASFAILQAEKGIREGKVSAESADAKALAEKTQLAGAALPAGGEEDKRKTIVASIAKGGNDYNARRFPSPEKG